MEKFFVVLGAFASTVTNIPLANGLKVLENSMRELWEKTVGEIASLNNSVDYWRNLYHAERNVSLMKTEDLENLKAEYSKKEQEQDRNDVETHLENLKKEQEQDRHARNNVLETNPLLVENLRISNDHLCWDVTIPYTWIKKYKEYAADLLRTINPLMPLDDVHARVENAIVKKQEMFSTLLSTTEYLEVRKTLYRTGSIRSDDVIVDGVEIRFIP
jgi:hypothetical protein